MLPCNVIVQAYDNGEVEVSSIDPATAMEAVGNPQLAAVARQVRAALERVVERRETLPCVFASLAGRQARWGYPGVT